MIIRNIVASVTLFLVAFASLGQKIDSLNELLQGRGDLFMMFIP